MLDIEFDKLMILNFIIFMRIIKLYNVTFHVQKCFLAKHTSV